MSISGCSVPDPQHSTFTSLNVRKSLVRSTNRKKSMGPNPTDVKMEVLGRRRVIGQMSCLIDTGKKTILFKG